MSLSAFPSKRSPLLLALLPLLMPALLLGACSSDDDNQDAPLVVPAAPKGLGTVDTAAVQDETQVPPFIDNIASNQRGDARYATLQTNAGVRVVAGFLDIWQPSTLLVDADLRHPSSSKAFGLGETAGLVELLAGTVKPEQVIRAFSKRRDEIVAMGGSVK